MTRLVAFLHADMLFYIVTLTAIDAAEFPLPLSADLLSSLISPEDQIETFFDVFVAWHGRCCTGGRW